MPSPKDIKKLMNAAKGAKSASKPDFEAVMANLPKGSPKAQLEAQLMFERLQAEKDAFYAPKAEDKTKGKAALQEIKGQLRENAKQRFLEPSAEKRRMYHGTRHYKPGVVTFDPENRPTGEGIREFQQGRQGLTFVSPDVSFANTYAGDAKDDVFKSGAVYPVHVQVRNPFDYENADHLDLMVDELEKLMGGSPNTPSFIHSGPDKIRAALRRGTWDIIESPPVLEAAKRLGFDGMYMNEQGVKNLGVFDPKRIKSAIGNQGTYDINDPDITKAEGGLALAGGGGKLLKALKGSASKGTKAAKAAGKLELPEAPLTLAERQLIAEKAPHLLIPSKLANVEKAIRESKGEFGAKRVQRAADEIRGLEDLYTEQALRDAFGGDNATALMIGNPAEFQEFASRLDAPYRPAVERYWHSMEPDAGRGAEDVPYLMLNKEEGRLPFVAGHEGRHRNIAATELGYPSTLWRMLPRAALREPLPRRSQEEYLEALMNELGSDTPLVIPEGRFLPRLEETDELKRDWTKALQLPKLFAEGGLAMAKGGKLLKALRKAEATVEPGKDLQSLIELNRPLTASERVMIGKPTLEPERRAALMNAERALPLNLPRAAAKSKQEIAAHAERVGRQMLGEHVRSGKPKDTQNLAGRSLKESQRLQNLRYELEPLKELPPVTTVDPRIGDINVAVPGDTSISDFVLKSIEDEPIGSVQQGGSLYGLGKLDRDDPLFWASNEGPAQQMQDKITDVAVLFEPERVLAQHLAMGRVANNFAQHFADASLRAIDYSKLSAKDMNTFDNVIAGGYTKKNQKTGEVQYITFPHWPGIADPEGALATMKADPELRKWFLSRMKTPKLTQATNMPNGLDIEWAITHPELRNMEVNLTGHSVGEMVPGAKLADDADHETYLKGIRGRFLGQQENLTPFAISYPDATQHIATTQRPQDFTGTIQKVFPHQRVDQQYIDEYGEYMRQLNKFLTGRKNGGEVHMQGGGDPGEVSGEMFKPKPLKIPSLFQDTVDALKAEFERNRRSMVRPKSAQDVLMRGPVAEYVGAPMEALGDIGSALDHVQKTHPLLRKPASVMDTGPLRKPEMGYAPRVSLTPEGPYGSEAVRDMMKSTGMTTGTERPLFEMGASILAPTIGVGSYKLGKALAPTAREMLEAGLERAVEPTRMYAAPQGKPGKVKAPANPVGFYNPAEKAALNLQRKQGPGSAFISDMKKLEQGVNDERIAELGLDQLASKPNVTRDEVVALAEQNRIPLRESVRRPYQESDEYSETVDALKESIRYREGGIQQVQAELDRVRQTAPTSPLVQQYESKIETMRQSIARDKERLEGKKPSLFGPDSHPDYNMPGGENYREIRVSLPSNKRPMSYEDWRKSGSSEEWSSDGIVGTDFMHQTHHGDEPNVLFHLRVADHVDAEGKRGLLIDELQSDWHQAGREFGYKNNFTDQERKRLIDLSVRKSRPYETPLNASELEELQKLTEKDRQNFRGVPKAPFKDNWYQLGLKRAIKEAVDTGVDRVYLTTGNRQAARYTEDQRKGMKQWYDKTYKNFLEKYAKQHGGKLGMTKLEIGGEQNNWPAFRDWFANNYPPERGGGALVAQSNWDQGLSNRFVKEFTKGLEKNYEPVYYIDLTDAMRNSAKKGQSYKAGGAVTMAEGGAVDYESRFNEMLQNHIGMAEGGAVDYESRFNQMLQKHIGMAEGGEVNQYNSDPDMSDGGLFVAAPAFKNGGAVKSIWTVN